MEQSVTQPARFPWKQEYNTGNDLIDSQHKRLLELASILELAVMCGKGYQVIESAFLALAKYTNEHFYAEERFWTHNRSSLIDAHRQEHSAISEELAGMRHQTPNGYVFCTPNELANWVEQRLIRHFVSEDQKAHAELAKPSGSTKRLAATR